MNTNDEQHKTNSMVEKSISEPFIKRPIATTLIAVLIAIAGFIGFYLLPVSQLPQIEFPTISVQASLPGASPEIMATSVATPLERQLGRIAHISEMTSTSSVGRANIVIQFDLDRNINGAARDVQAAITAALSQLPSNLNTNPTYKKVNPADAPIMIIALTSDLYSRAEMYDYASTLLQQKLSQIDGVGQVTVGGSSLPAVRVELNPKALSYYNISLASVRNTLAAANAHTPTGELSHETTTSSIATNDQLFETKEYKPLIITYRNRNPVRIADVARVTKSVEDVKNYGLANGKPSVLLVVFKQPGENVIETVDRVRGIIPQLKASIPAAIDMTVVMDRTTTIRASLKDVEFTLMISIVLVILVVFLFLKNVRAAIIPSVTVPLSLLGTFAVMYLLGFSLDNLSLMALTISTGFVVDDAIVVLENVTRYQELGFSRLEAALKGTKEVGFTVLSISISLIAVFIPILLMGGILGRLFQEFAITLSVAILVSLFISLTITPMMCAVLLKPSFINQTQTSLLGERSVSGDSNQVLHNQKVKKRFNFFESMQSFYAKSLLWCLAHKRLVLVSVFLTITLNVFLFIVAPKGFFPQQDTGRITGSLQAEQNISFQAMQKKFIQVVSIVKADPAVENVVGFVGGGATNSANVFIALKPLDERKISADLVIKRLRESTKKVQGADLFLKATQDLVIGGKQGNAQFQYTIFADNSDDLNHWEDKIKQELQKIKGIVDVNSDKKNNGLEVNVKINHEKAAALGLTTRQIDSTLYAAFGQAQVSTMYKDVNQYHVIMTIDPKYWQTPDSLNDIYMISNKGESVPLSTFAEFIPDNTLLAVNHQSQFPASTLTFNLLPGNSLGQIVDKVNQAVKKLELPETVQASFQGTAKAFQESLSSQPFLILMALIAVYIVLGILYESIVHPITILSTLPSAGVGALIALIISGTDLTIIALIGMILLIGIVKKNAIMMIDFALQLKRNENKSSAEAIHKAALLRFRPIMMTTMAALLGAIPLAFDYGVGAEIRRPLGISIVGGLAVSQLLTLYTTPIIYLYLEKIAGIFSRKRKINHVEDYA